MKRTLRNPILLKRPQRRAYSRTRMLKNISENAMRMDHFYRSCLRFGAKESEFGFVTQFIVWISLMLS